MKSEYLVPILQINLFENAHCLQICMYENILKNRYTRRMQKLSREFWDRPMTPQKSIVYWTEYVLRHNGTQFAESLPIEVPFFQYFLLDIVALIFIIFFVIIFVAFCSCKFIFKSLRHHSSQKNKKL